MKGAGLLFSLLFVLSIYASAQNPSNIPTRAERFKKLEGQMIFPLINAGYLSGVLPVNEISERPDPNAEVKLMFDFTQATSSGNQAQKVNEGISEVVRVLNLHAAAGIPKDKIKAIIVFHAASITTVMSDAFYQKQFQSDNPNANLLRELNDLGCNLVVCGQSLQLREIASSNLLPFIKVALAAKTTLSKYHQQGYFLFEIKGE